MRGKAVVDIGSGNAVECSRRLLLAIRSGSLESLNGALARARRVCERATGSSLADEQADLLGAIVERMRHEPCAEAEISLLGRLAQAA